jgi:hypothetical protein
MSDHGDAARAIYLQEMTMRGWFGRLIEIVAVTVSVSLSASRWASPAAAQTPPALAHTIDVLAAGSLGFADLGEHGGLAGQFAFSTAVDQMVITLRAAGAGEYSEQASDRTYGDVALLVGMRATHPKIPVPGKFGATTASISLGLARLYFNQPPLASSPERSGAVPAIAFDADLMAHLRVIGVGVSMFGAAGTNNRYLGVGLTLALGKIH